MMMMKNSHEKGLEMMMKKKTVQKEEDSSAGVGMAGWEVRPCGMLVQKRDPDSDPHPHPSSLPPLIRVKVSYGRSTHHVSISAHASFGELKKALVQDTGLQPKQQRLLYHGKEKKDATYLSEVGVKNKSKIVLVEDAASWEKRLLELRKNEAKAKACKAVAEAQQVVDKLSGQIANIEGSVLGGKHIMDSELTGVVDLLMHQLVILDASKVEGETNVQKTILVRRVQKYVEKLDVLNVKNDQLRAQNDVGRNDLSREDGIKGIQNSILREGGLRSARNDILRESGTENSISRDSGSNGIQNDLLRGSRIKAVQNNLSREDAHNSVVTTSWETFNTNVGSHNVSVKPIMPSNLSMKPPLPINRSVKLMPTVNASVKTTAPLVSEPLLIQWD